MKCMKNIEPSLEIKQLRLFLSLIESQSLTHTADTRACTRAHAHINTPHPRTWDAMSNAGDSDP